MKIKFRYDYVNLVPNDIEHRLLFHISKHSFVVLLTYLRMENFFGAELEGQRGPGRPKNIADGAVLLGILNYFTMSCSIIQASFRCGKVYNNMIGISPSTLCRNIKRFIELMLDIWDKIIYISPINEWKNLKFLYSGSQFEFDNAKLAVDGSLITKQICISDEAVFFDRKGNCSINCMFVFDYDCNIRSMYINKPGSCNDKRVIKDSYFYRNIENILPDGFYCLADSGYELTTRILTPYRRAALTNDEGGIKLFYNTIQSSARMVAERGIGLLKQRCKPLMNGLYISKSTKCVRFIAASAILHQLLLNIEGKAIEENVEEREVEDEEDVDLNQLREESGLPSVYRDALARKMYFKYTISCFVFSINSLTSLF